MLNIYNSLTRKIEPFEPINSSEVGIYTCGPTVYNFAHIGNFRTYTTSDILLRTLKYNGYNISYYMNLTDVGHLTGDNEGDADAGEDRMEKSAKKEGKTAWQIAKFYSEVFEKDFEKLNLLKPIEFVRATDHIKEQIELVEKLEKKGFTYKTSDGVYFDTSKFPKYGEISNLDQIKEGARVEKNPEKKNPRDFALWKFSPKSESGFEKRQMEWESPWGVGFPGWHIECSAMSMKYLGETFDIHVGGVDLRETHHPNEIAQSEAATGKKFVNFWVHSAFMLVQGERMSKSMGNAYRLYDLEKEGHDPMSLRYLYLQTHYRQEMNFTFSALDAAAAALSRLREFMIQNNPGDLSHDEEGAKEYEKLFLDSLNDDLNTPQAISVVFDLIRSDVPTRAKVVSLLKFDEVLGFDLLHAGSALGQIPISDLPQNVARMVEEREVFRREQRYKEADTLRERIWKLGYEVLDTEKGSEVRKAS